MSVASFLPLGHQKNHRQDTTSLSSLLLVGLWVNMTEAGSIVFVV